MKHSKQAAGGVGAGAGGVGAAWRPAIKVGASADAAANEAPAGATMRVVDHVATTDVLNHGAALRTRSDSGTRSEAPLGAGELRIQAAVLQACLVVLFCSATLLLNDVPTEVAVGPWDTADAAAAMAQSALLARHWTWGPALDCTGDPMTVGNRAHDPTSAARLLALLVVDVLARPHDTAHDDGRNLYIVVGAPTTPADAAENAAPAEAVAATLLTQAPRSFMLPMELKAKVALPPLGYNLAQGSCIDRVLERVQCAGLRLRVREAR